MRVAIKHFFIAFVCLVLPLSSASISNGKEIALKPKTKLERLIAKTGIILIRGSHMIGSVIGEFDSSVNIKVKELSDVSSGTKQYGVTVEAIKSSRKNISYVDYDELRRLIEGIEYISPDRILKTNPEISKFSSFMSEYSTKGNLRISTYNAGIEVTTTVNSGNIQGVSAYFKTKGLAKIKSLLVKAKSKIEEINK